MKPRSFLAGYLAALLTVIGLLAVAALAFAMPVPAATSSDPAPLIRLGKDARADRVKVRAARCLPRPSYRRPVHQLDGWKRHWHIHVQRARLARDLARPSRCLPTTPEGIIRYVFPSATESAAVRVAYCESRLWPYARNPSGASGLFQLMPNWWRNSDGSLKFNPFDAWANTRFAAQLSRQGYDWSHWVCKP